MQIIHKIDNFLYTIFPSVIQGEQQSLLNATNFYDKYLQYKDDKEPTEEYELVLHWAEDLKLDKNFELVNEHEYRTKRTDIDNLLS